MIYKLKSYLILIILLKARSVAMSEDFCDDGVFDAITEVKNGIIIIFKGPNLWEFEADRLSGPIPIKGRFSELSGSIDAAVTIGKNAELLEFYGASLYFQGNEFYTYKNFRAYQIEWGSLVYMPYKGLKSEIGSIDKKIELMMSSEVMAAYFDPNDLTTNLLFSDSSVLSFKFELDYKHDKPLVSDLNTRLSRYGIKTNITATAAFYEPKKNQLYLFLLDKYCVIDMIDKGRQDCVWNSTKTLFRCDSVVKNGIYSTTSYDLNLTSVFTESQTNPDKTEDYEPNNAGAEEEVTNRLDETTHTNTANPQKLSIISFLLLISLFQF